MAAIVRGPAVILSPAGSSVRTAALPTGTRYLITASADVHIRQGGSAVVATTSDTPLWSKSYLEIKAESDDLYVAAIGTATVTLTPLAGV